MGATLTADLREARRRAYAAEEPLTSRRATSGAGSAPLSLIALQRSVGNAAVTALLAARARPGGGERVSEIDAALLQARSGQPDLDTLERGLTAAKEVGVAVDIDGADRKPPASALTVTKTGFGPSTVAAKKPVPPPKPARPSSPLAKGALLKHPVKGGKEGGAHGVGGSASSATAGTPTASTGTVDVLAPPTPPQPLRPEQDSAFAAVTGGVRSFAAVKRSHPTAASKAQEAQSAALAPSDDIDSQAKAAKVDTMEGQPAGTFDKRAFIAAVKAAIEAKAPKNLEEADEYRASGKAGQVKGEVKGLVAGNKQQSAEAIETATAATPDTSKAVARPVGALQAEDPGRPAAIPAAGAAPKPAPPDQLNFEAGKHQAVNVLAGADVSEAQLATSNEAEFTGALAAKHEAAAHADTGPAQFRQAEAATLAAARTDADGTSKAAVHGIQTSKTSTLAQVTGSKAATKAQDEAKRAEVSARVQSIYTATETAVRKTLDGIDPKVDQAFEAGEARAKAMFEAFVETKMSAYKRDRYGGCLGGYRWLKDKLTGMPSAVNEFFEAGREVYLKEMDRVISQAADIVGAELGAAKQRIAAGQAEIGAYVKALPNDLKKVGAEAADTVAAQFGNLESDVAAKQDAVVDTLATKYVDSRHGLDDRIEALQAENKGLVDKAIGAITDVVQTILKLKDMLLGVLARAAAAVGQIIKDPIGFLHNFVNAVKTGIVNFGTNVLDHLKKGLQEWLFGALSEGGVELPEAFDLKGVVKLVLSVVGATWGRVRARIVAKIGAPAMDFVERGLDIVKVIVSEGLGGVWRWVLEKVGDVKTMVMEQVEEMVSSQIIKAGITWLISMLNPAGAFIKACKVIYDVVMFFVEKASQLGEFVDAVIDSVASVATGGVGAVAAKIEATLGKMVPLLIGFLASLLGLGGIADKIKKIIETIQKPITKVIDWVVGKAVAFGKKFTGVANKVTGAWAKGKAKAGAVVAKGVAWGKGKAQALRDRMLGVTFRRTFEVDGESHSMYSTRSKPAQLYVASSEPGKLSKKVPAAAALDAQFAANVNAYLAAVKRLAGDKADPARVKEAEASKSKADELLLELVGLAKSKPWRGASALSPAAMHAELAAALATLERAGMGPAGRAAVEGVFKRRRDSTQASGFGPAVKRVVQAAELITERPDLGTSDGRKKQLNSLSTMKLAVLGELERGVTIDGQAIENTKAPKITAAVKRMESAYQSLSAKMGKDPIEGLFRLEKMRAEIARVSEVLRVHSSNFTAKLTYGKTVTDSTGVTIDTIQVVATGSVKDGFWRGLPGAGKERSLPTPGKILKAKTMPLQLAADWSSKVQGFHRAHLIGPGFGGELKMGIMLAPSRVNLNTQNKGVEHFIRRSAATGCPVDLVATALGARVRLPLAAGGVLVFDVLSRVSYLITVNEKSFTVTIETNPYAVHSTVPTNAPGAEHLK
ncbi:hypothetical protein BA895_05710 [Humibacillus sp. DSM 29435]|uniref:polymorphic toxin type 4 domain-containing protein n=1 Tax=Humibacillus sp. DSM 29435 TaxID=1869167 RepID=UPI00087274EA|nr:polymorphic toxin type 4 domain-containing protein [Humibacillus sp. DSM 29435]OFE15251.1 hypothetical protein BA895_05710 [Humibacillus sp. DSM 29435]